MNRIDESAFTQTGSGEPVLLFVHGFACAREDWDGQIAQLSQKYRCIAMDLPGHGRAPGLDSHRLMPALADAVNRVRREAGVGKVILIGHSLGVRVIIDAYLDWPQDVLGLVFVDGRFYDGEPSEVEERVNGWVAPGFQSFVANAFAGMFTASSDAALRERVVARAVSMDPAFGQALLIQSILWDSTRGREALRHIQIPLLHLQSTDIDADRRMITLKPGTKTAFMQLVETLVPDADVKVVPDVGHFATLEAPMFVTMEISRFVSRFEVPA